MDSLTAAHLNLFDQQGFVIIENFGPPDLISMARARFAPLFRGEFETGVQPDEWNWREGRDADDLTRQICNGWKSDRAIARLVLRPQVGETCARLMGWPGARINQDNILWTPPGAQSLGFHQDDSYQQWVLPPEMVSCWMALDATVAQGGTIEYAVGSHRWPRTPKSTEFHAPPDYRKFVDVAARDLGITEVEIAHIEVAAGSAVFHHGRIWHGSGANLGSTERRAVVSHCMRSDARFHPQNVSAVYGRYKYYDRDDMDESFFPVLWTQGGYRSSFLDEV